MTEYLKLTKPSIMLLVLFTGGTALVVEGSMLSQPGRFLLFMVALYLTGGCANALNQFFERDIDAKMSRTCARRPLPQKKLTPIQALIFSVTIGLVGLAILAFWFNWLTALLSLGTILFYGLIYTLILKPGTSLNIVIGGAAGAMAPVGAWAAATGTTALTPWLMFAIIFLWTPPHFWALAIAYKDDYRLTELPMLPVVAGDKATLRQIWIYSLLLVGTSVALAFLGSGWIYLSVAVALGAWFLVRAAQASAQKDDKAVMRLFRFSILYLFGLFGTIMIDAVLMR